MSNRKKSDLLAYDSFLCKEEERDLMAIYFESLQMNFSQAKFSEMLDTHTASVSRDIVSIKKVLAAPERSPFKFILCLN
jgi:hypothetical protein